MTKALERGEGSASRPGRSLPPGKTRYPLYRRLGGSQGRSGQVRKISLPPGFDSRTVQPVASHYTDWTTRPTSCLANRLQLSVVRSLWKKNAQGIFVEESPKGHVDEIGSGWPQICMPVNNVYWFLYWYQLDTQFLYKLHKIKFLYMFRASSTHLQEVNDVNR